MAHLCTTEGGTCVKFIAFNVPEVDMNPKYKPRNPRPITSFLEDEFELKLKINKPTQPSTLTSRYFTILFIRLVMALTAGIIAMWLYVLANDFITHHQQQRRITAQPR